MNIGGKAYFTRSVAIIGRNESSGKCEYLYIVKMARIGLFA